MNWYCARQRESDGRWDYTNRNSTGTYALGYCAGWRELDHEHLGKIFGVDRLPWFEQDLEKRRAHQGKYHADGHATAGEADACYRQYQLDNELRLHDPPADPDALHKCAVCGTFTAGMAEIGEHWHRHLCDAHRTREAVAGLFLAPS